jgi:hypothetical protein
MKDYKIFANLRHRPQKRGPHCWFVGRTIRPEAFHSPVRIRFDDEKSDQIVTVWVGQCFNIQIDSDFSVEDRRPLRDVDFFLPDGECLKGGIMLSKRFLCDAPHPSGAERVRVLCDSEYTPLVQAGDLFGVQPAK